MSKHDLNLIPFGLSEKDGKFLDVAEVAQGKQCGCICPSCKTPLIARQGQVKEWHFAHATKVTSSATRKPCKFSFFVSVRLMARQILGQNLEVLLPAFEDSASISLAPFYGQVSARFNITGQHRITLSQIEIEQTFMGKPVDIIGHIGEFSFIIYFTHPGRHVPAEFYHPPDAHCGILALSLEPLPALFQTAKKQQKSYLKILHHFLCNNLPSKNWVFHPRYAQRKQQAMDKLQQQVEAIIERKIKQREEMQQQAKLQQEKREQERQQRAKRWEERQRSNKLNNQTEKKSPESRRKLPEKSKNYIPQQSSPEIRPVKTTPLYPPPAKIKGLKITQSTVHKRQAQFECVLCKTRWQGPEPSDSPCPKCSTHLYRKFINFVDE